jgi:hypothetical protein
LGVIIFLCIFVKYLNVMGIVVKELGKKWEQIFDDPDETMIWRYDTSKNKFGPYEVEIKYKRPVVKTKKVTRKVTLNK